MKDSLTTVKKKKSVTRPPSKYGQRDAGGRRTDKRVGAEEKSLMQIISELETKEQGKYRMRMVNSHINCYRFDTEDNESSNRLRGQRGASGVY